MAPIAKKMNSMVPRYSTNTSRQNSTSRSPCGFQIRLDTSAHVSWRRRVMGSRVCKPRQRGVRAGKGSFRLLKPECLEIVTAHRRTGPAASKTDWIRLPTSAGGVCKISPQHQILVRLSDSEIHPSLLVSESNINVPWRGRPRTTEDGKR
jgi:hypothetical protein